MAGHETPGGHRGRKEKREKELPGPPSSASSQTAQAPPSDRYGDGVVGL